MAWRSVMISRPARLRREHFSLAIDQEKTSFVPFEDIAVIVLDHQQITLTHPLLSACAEYGISLFSTGDNHQPNGVFLPYLQHSRATRMLRLQLDVPRPAAKQAWATIIRQKIANQACCLTLAGCEGARQIESYARRVRSGDTGNCEALAASRYFPQLFGQGFHRSQNRWINAMLDYGYAVLRGTIARGLVAHGLLPSLGLCHANEQNAFNLADDLIEPYRPTVDLHVASQPQEKERGLLPVDKASLIALLNVDIIMPRGTMSVLAAIEQSVESLVRFYENKNADSLELPMLTGLRQHLREQ